MPAPKLENFDRVLVVEGYSDLRFYAEFLEAIGKHEKVFVKHFNGKDDLLLKLDEFVSPELVAAKLKIGIIVDADENPAGTFLGIKNRMLDLTGQAIPAHGTWSGGSPDLGLFVTPDGQNPGELETLVWNAWSANPANGTAKACIEQYRDCMAAAGHKAKSLHKGLLSSLLAIRNDEDPRLGPGAQRRIFDFAHPLFAGLRTFLSNF